MRRRTFLAANAAAVACGIAGCAGDSTPPRTETSAETTATASFPLTSPAFDDGGSLPGEFGCGASDGGVSPPLTPALPDDADSWAVVVTDPDAPNGTFTHWTIWGVPPGRDLPRDVPATPTLADLNGAKQGRNDFGDVGYGAPCPPRGDDAHHYRFDAYALGCPLDLDASASPDAVSAALDATDVLANARLTATYARKTGE